jgi:hypothetical protein
MCDGVPGFILWDGGIGRADEIIWVSGCEATISEASPRAGVYGGAIIGVDHVAGRAAAGAKISWVIICAEEVECGVKESGFLEADEYGIGAVSGAKSTVAETRSWAAGFFETFGNSGVGYEAAAAFEDAEDISRLCDFESGEWIEVREDTFSRCFLGGWSGHGLESLGRAVHAVAFTISGPFVGDSAVVVEGGAPEHAAVCHHTFFDVECFGAVAACGAAAEVCNAKVSGVYKADEFGIFVIEDGVGADGICGGAEDIIEAGVDMSVEFRECLGISTVAVCAAEFDGVAEMRVVRIFVAGDAAGAFCSGLSE